MNIFRILNSKVSRIFGQVFATFFLLCAGAQGQSFPDFSSIEIAQTASTADRPCNQQPSKQQPSIPQVSVYQRYSQARRDREQEVLIVFCVGKHKGAGCPLSQPANQGQFSPVFLELESSEHLTVRYREGKKFQSTPLGGAIPAGASTFLKVQIPRDADLGAHTLKGKLTFEASHPGHAPRQQLEITIPLSVVEHDTKVSDVGWPFKSPSHLWKRVREGLAVPILAPAALFFFVGCSIADCDF